MNKKVILLVDDDFSSRALIRKILEMRNYLIVEAANGLYAIEVLKRQHIDLVITDILMPEMNGYELSQKIYDDFKPLKVIVMTAGGRVGSADYVKSLCIKEFFDAILTKPFKPDKMIYTIESALREEVKVN